MAIREHRPASTCLSGLTLSLLVLAGGSAHAADARTSDKAKPGEIVLLRTVDTRPATRMQPPGIALLVNPSPKREINDALGNDDGMAELGDTDIAGLTSGMTDGLLASSGQLPNGQRAGIEKLEGILGTTTGGGMLASGQLADAIGTPMRAVGGATRSAGEQVRGALAQFPLGGR